RSGHRRGQSRQRRAGSVADNGRSVRVATAHRANIGGDTRQWRRICLKRVVSVSIGSSARDHAVELELMGQQVRVERIGTDGDIDKAIELISKLDGEVDAFGMGGIDLYVWAGGRRYELRDARRIARAAKTTPIVDGSGLKNSLERRIVTYLEDAIDIRW